MLFVDEKICFATTIEWKNREDRKPLILNGARQVGKTWLLHEFAKLWIQKRGLWWYAVRITLHASFFLRISMLTEFLRGCVRWLPVDITPGDTLIILDEIQDIPKHWNLWSILKRFRYPYSCGRFTFWGYPSSGCVSYPVGKVNVINIFPMNFEEFLVAKGEEEACKLLMSGDFETISLLHDDNITDPLRQYYM